MRAKQWLDQSTERLQLKMKRDRPLLACRLAYAQQSMDKPMKANLVNSWQHTGGISSESKDITVLFWCTFVANVYSCGFGLRLLRFV